MAVVYSTTLKNTRMDAVTTALSTSATIVVGTSALSGATGVLATIPCKVADAFTASVSGVITLDGLPISVVASASGTAALAEFRTSGGTVVVSGLTVGTGGQNIVLGTTSVNSGDTVSITSGTITHG